MRAWPGNVRELRAEVRRAAVLSTQVGKPLTPTIWLRRPERRSALSAQPQFSFRCRTTKSRRRSRRNGEMSSKPRDGSASTGAGSAAARAQRAR